MDHLRSKKMGAPAKDFENYGSEKPAEEAASAESGMECKDGVCHCGEGREPDPLNLFPEDIQEEAGDEENIPDKCAGSCGEPVGDDGNKCEDVAGCCGEIKKEEK
jgi:hypothetical protein